MPQNEIDLLTARILALEYAQKETLGLVLSMHEDPKVIDVFRYTSAKEFYPRIPEQWRAEAQTFLDGVHAGAERIAASLRPPRPEIPV
jgi:hypothetical protein